MDTPPPPTLKRVVAELSNVEDAKLKEIEAAMQVAAGHPVKRKEALAAAIMAAPPAACAQLPAPEVAPA